MLSLPIRLAVLCLLPASLALSPALGEERGKLSVRRDGAWDRVFERSEGWTGADVAGTVALGDGRVLWVFGDTWVGRVVDGKHAAGSRLVNNSIAVHRIVPGGGAPEPKDVEFVWGAKPDAAGHPTAWVVPDADSVRPDRTIDDAKHPNGWYWAAGGGAVLPTETGEGRLAVFLFHVARRSSGDSVWSFRPVGGAIAVVDDIAGAARGWSVRQVDLVHSRPAPPESGDKESGAVSWGQSVLRETQAGGDRLYVYGIRVGALGTKDLLVARVAARELLSLDRWRFWNGSDWASESAEAESIADGLVSELSVDRLREAAVVFGRPGAGRLVLVQSEPYLGSGIFLRTAERPEGPWSTRREVFRVEEVADSKKLFTYAAKGHLDLSRPGELLITYLVNSHDFWHMAGDASIYRPRSLRVSLR